MNEKVTMRSPFSDETREVDPNGPELLPLMVQGWNQVPNKSVPAAKLAETPKPAEK